MTGPHNQHRGSTPYIQSLPTTSSNPTDIVQDALTYLHACDPSPVNAALTYEQVAAVFAAHDNFADVVASLHNELGAVFTAKQFGRATFVKHALEDNKVSQSQSRYSYPWYE